MYKNKHFFLNNIFAPQPQGKLSWKKVKYHCEVSASNHSKFVIKINEETSKRV